MTLSPGTRLGAYEILALLGAGGMGEVYRARDSRLGRDVAVKVLPGDFLEGEERRQRFEREARLLAALNHPGIAAIYSFEEIPGASLSSSSASPLATRHLLVMELVEGEGLDQRVASGPLPLEELLSLGTQIAEALAEAHEKGIVHRDLKPANIVVGRSGRVKVLDFGLATFAHPEAAPGADSKLPTDMRTREGVVMGTVPYMSPEQARGQALDHRSDVFSLGIILYEMASGRRPFQGDSAAELVSSILRDAPAPLARVRDDLPSNLDRIVARCLEKDPRARFQTALDVANDLRRMHPGRAADVAGGVIVKPPPAPSTPLLGREEALEAAVERLRGGARVLTVTGYGGTGKTRFAIELFRRLASGYAGGAAFVSLASVTAAADVLPAVGVTLEIGEAQGRSALEALSTVVGDRRVLLVLDNLEQVLDAAPDIAALVARCPALSVIATSRAPLKIGAESEFGLPPLELPAEGATSPEALKACPSVALFVQRAEKVKGGFALTDSNAAAIAAICRRLDGLPLALELAAARVRVLEPAALLSRLDHALDLLTSGDRDLPIRQRTLRATISWSYSLLDSTEQGLLRQLSVFHEGWTLEAMERVCFGEDERPRALDALDSLVEKGLVRVIGSGGRYALLETIRAFAAEQLHAGGEVDAVRESHADYFLAFARGVDSGIKGTGQLDAVRRARADNANMHAAVQWLTARARAGDAAALEKGLLLSGHLNWFWHIGGQHLTARVAVDALLGLPAPPSPSRGRGLALLTSAMICSVTGEWERCLTDARAAHEIGLAMGDPAVAAEGIMFVGYAHLHEGRMAEARTALDETIERSARGVSDFLHSVGLTLEGMLLFATGNLDAGIALVEQARRIQERAGDYELGGVALSFLAQMTFAKGDPARATALYRDALAALEAVGDHPEIARVHCEMGWTALAAADAREARRAFRLAVQEYEGVGSPRGIGLALLGLAAVEAAEGRAERAVAIAAAAHALSERAGVVVEHPMDPGVVERIEALKASIPTATLDGLVANAGALTPAAVLAMVAD